MSLAKLGEHFRNDLPAGIVNSPLASVKGNTESVTYAS